MADRMELPCTMLLYKFTVLASITIAGAATAANERRAANFIPGTEPWEVYPAGTSCGTSGTSPSGWCCGTIRTWMYGSGGLKFGLEGLLGAMNAEIGYSPNGIDQLKLKIAINFITLLKRGHVVELPTFDPACAGICDVVGSNPSPTACNFSVPVAKVNTCLDTLPGWFKEVTAQSAWATCKDRPLLQFDDLFVHNSTSETYTFNPLCGIPSISIEDLVHFPAALPSLDFWRCRTNNSPPPPPPPPHVLPWSPPSAPPSSANACFAKDSTTLCLLALPTGIIIGAAVGGVALLGAIIAGAWWCMKGRAKQNIDQAVTVNVQMATSTSADTN